MSMIGIGLGGFMEGYQQSRRNRLDEERQKALLDRQKKVDARTDIENARDDAKYARDEAQRQEIADINTRAQQDFDTRVQAGTEQAGGFDDFWDRYALPQVTNTLRKNGDIEGARKFQEWGEADGAKRGGRLWQSSWMKAQQGNYQGAVDDLNSALSTPGYFGDGYKVSILDDMVTPEGKKVGMMFRLTDKDGKTFDKPMRLDQIPNFIVTAGNPEAAYKHYADAQGDQTKRANDLEDYETKKKIDKRYGTGNDYAKSRGDAITVLRKRYPAHDETTAEDAPPAFDDLPRADQDKMIAGEIELQNGQPAPGDDQPGIGSGAPAAPTSSGAPPQKVLYNNNTGEVRQTPRPAPQQAQPQQQSAPLSRDENVSYLLQSADEAAKAGENPERIADSLKQNGIPAEQWPESLATALALSQKTQIGLGGR